jgi:flagellar hook assembly protein FlgD
MESIKGRVDQALIDQAVQDTAQKGSSGSSFDGDMFLQMLLTQLQNQDPFNTVETDKIMEQQAILSQVEQGIKQTQSLDDVKASLETGLSDIAYVLANINNLVNTLVKKETGGSGNNTGNGSGNPSGGS